MKQNPLNIGYIGHAGQGKLAFAEYTRLCKNNVVIPIIFDIKSEESLLSDLKKGIEDIDIPLCDVCRIDILLPNNKLASAWFSPNFTTLEKADYGGKEAYVGEVRVYGGVEKQKQADGTWMRYYGNEHKSGKMNADTYHKNMVSLKASKVKELLKQYQNKDEETARKLLENSFYPDAEHEKELHQYHHQEVINKLAKEGVITGTQVPTPISKLFGRASLTPAVKIQQVVENRVIPEGMNTLPLHLIEKYDKVKAQLSVGQVDAIIESVRSDGKVNLLIPSKRAHIQGVALNKLLSKYVNGEEFALVKEDIKPYNELKEEYENLMSDKSNPEHEEEKVLNNLLDLKTQLNNHPGRIKEGSEIYNKTTNTAYTVDKVLENGKILATDDSGIQHELSTHNMRIQDHKFIPNKDIKGVDIEEDDNTLKIEGDEDLAEDAAKVGQIQTLEEPVKKINTQIYTNDGGQEFEVFDTDKDTGNIGIRLISDGGGWENYITPNEFNSKYKPVETFNSDELNTDYVFDLIDDENAGADEINDFQLSSYFTDLKNKKDKTALNLAFQAYKAQELIKNNLNILKNFNQVKK